jgi:hypothetical protein
MSMSVPAVSTGFVEAAGTLTLNVVGAAGVSMGAVV